MRWHVLLAGILWLGVSFAHHSGAIFDSDHMLTLRGTVRLFQWTNPHCFIEMDVKSPTASTWSIEMGSPSQLFRLGWRPGTVKPREEIIVVVNPLRDGSHGGQFLSAQDAAGKMLGSVGRP